MMARMLLAYLLIALGFYFLVQGAHWLVEGSASLAQRLRVSDLIIGLTVLAFGTSAPELVVNSLSSWRGAGEIVIGNIVGSNIMNIALILGASALVAPVPVRDRAIFRELPLGAAGAILIWLLAGRDDGYLVLGRLAGTILLLGFVLFLRSVISARQGEELLEEIEQEPERTLVMASLLTVVGLILLFFGGRLVVEQAVFIAARYGASESLIGLTLVAFGTGLPELAASLAAAWRGRPDMALGNVAGSNIFNIFLVLGLSAALRPVRYNAANLTDVAILTAVSVLLPLGILLNRRRHIDRRQGGIFLTVYAVYMVFAVWRG